MAGEWTQLRLGDVCTKIGSGATPRGGGSVYLDRGDVALIRSQNIYNDGFHHVGLVYLTERHANELSNVEVAEDDVLLNITGDSVARVCQVDPGVLPARVNQHVAIIRPDPKRLSPLFLRYYLASPLMQTEMRSLAGAGATRNALTKGMIGAFIVPAPEDVNEQHTIASILGSLDAKIECNRRMNRTLEASARAVFQSWFVDFDPVRARVNGRPPAGMDAATAALFPEQFEDSDLGKIPAGWKIKQLGDLIELKRGYDLPSHERKEGNVPVVSSAGLSGWHSMAKVKGPGVVTGRYGTIGQVHYVEEDYWPLNTTLYVRDFKGHAPRFIECVLGTVQFDDYSDKAAVPGINRNHLHMAKVVLPPACVEDQFASFVGPLWQRHAANCHESRTLAALRDALLPKLISGELRIPDAERLVGRAT
jgi:type I restriction enzyme S subunit